ncbi:MAG: hypothetical protein JXM79_14395 [Sedimentisphaerales bacterium]|nr:hypothetical protein [Sedimentisphaerales bacterium]
MAKDKEQTKNSVESAKQKRIQCHFVSNTHWDREWRYSMQRTRYMLVNMLDMLFDIFEKEPNFKSFHLDSQTIPIQDYLEIRPEREALVKKYVSEGRLVIGPWFCLPDEFCVGGESLIRNLLLGHRIALRFGKVGKSGYSPFSWGQISQMPQIYKGFGIHFAAFYRGINTIVAPRSEIIWEGPDGSQLVVSRLGYRPRYNVWYVIQRPVYYNEKEVDNRKMSWKRGHGPFKFIDQANCELDAQYAHPRIDYFKERIAEQAQQAIDEQNDDWTTAHRFWSCGHDSSCPDIREVQMIADCDEALGETADVFHSTLAGFQKGVCENIPPDLPVVKGEMRHTFTKGSSGVFFGRIISARTDIKQDNFRTERALTCYAEPLAVFAALLGVPYPQGFIDRAYNWLLQNHGHDSIGGCSRDIISEDMLFRSRQTREISSCVMERAMLDITGSINLSNYSHEDMALVVFNPAPFTRTEVISAAIDIPLEWDCESFEILDEKGERSTLQFCDKVDPHYQIVQDKNDCANIFPMTRYHIRAEFKDIPGMGYRTFFVKPVETPKLAQPKTMLTSPLTMENEHLAVTVNSNGTLTVRDKKTDRLFEGLGYFRDSSEIGNPWEHYAAPNESVFTTLNEKAQVALVRDGELEASFRITINWALPAGRTKDEKARSEDLKTYKIVNTVTLRRDQPWVDVTTEVDNCVEDHYLQVSFPTGIKTDSVMVQGQFDVIQRPVAAPDYSLYEEPPQTEHPMNSFIDMSDGQIGLALLNEGLKAYQTDNDPANTVSLTLLRCFPLRICVTTEMTDYSRTDKGSQCPGKQSFRYAIMPHRGDWEEARIWQAAERFNLAFVAGQIGPTKEGTQPLSKSFLELRPDTLHLSAIKRSESDKGWIVRLFNPSCRTISAGIRLNAGHTGQPKTQSPVERAQNHFALLQDNRNPWNSVRVVTLEEIFERDLMMDDDSWVNFEIEGKKILTVEFLP